MAGEFINFSFMVSDFQFLSFHFLITRSCMKKCSQMIWKLWLSHIDIQSPRIWLCVYCDKGPNLSFFFFLMDIPFPFGKIALLHWSTEPPLKQLECPNRMIFPGVLCSIQLKEDEKQMKNPEVINKNTDKFDLIFIK